MTFYSFSMIVWLKFFLNKIKQIRLLCTIHCSRSHRNKSHSSSLIPTWLCNNVTWPAAAPAAAAARYLQRRTQQPPRIKYFRRLYVLVKFFWAVNCWPLSQIVCGEVHFKMPISWLASTLIRPRQAGARWRRRLRLPASRSRLATRHLCEFGYSMAHKVRATQKCY